MQAISRSVIVLATLLACTSTTKVDQCKGRSYEKLSDNVDVIPCTTVPCKLKKGTSTTVQLRFTPEYTIKTLRTNVHAQVLGIPLPFIGVDGVSACDKIFLADSPETPAPCPLEPGKSYLYNNSFPILGFYPRISLRVHWSISDGDNEILCYEVPAKIQ